MGRFKEDSNNKAIVPQQRPGIGRYLEEDKNKFPFEAFTCTVDTSDPRTLTLIDSWNLSVNGNLNVDGTGQIDGNLRVDGKIGVGVDPTYTLTVQSIAVTPDYIQLANSGAYAVGIRLSNSQRSWHMLNNTSGNFLITDASGSSNVIIIEAGSPASSIYIDNAGRVEVGGAFAAGAGGRLTATTGTYGALDVADTMVLILNASGGNITLNGFASGSQAQILSFMALTSGNTITINHNNAGGTEKILLNGAAAKTISDFGAGMFIESADYWYASFK